MTIEELALYFRNLHKKMPEGAKHSTGVIFGIRYKEFIKRGWAIKIVVKSGLGSTRYADDIYKGMALADYVEVKDDKLI